MNNIFSVANKVKSYEVTIGELTLVSDVIVSFEVCFKNDTPKVQAKLLIDDLYDMNAQLNWNETEVYVKYIDLKDHTTSFIFKITKINQFEHQTHRKALELELQDSFSYALEHSFLSKGFTSSTTNALSQYIDNLGISGYATDFTDSDDAESFTVPKNIDNLTFFLDRLYHSGYYFYQTRNGVFVKSLEDLAMGSLAENDDVFYDETDNQYYKNRILASRPITNDRSNVLEKTRSFYYDFDTKNIIYDETNDQSQYVVNSYDDDIQDTNGFIDVYQEHGNFNEHTRKLRDSYFSKNRIEIVTNGFGKNTLHQKYTLQLRGNKGRAESQQLGNESLGGVYVSYKIIDKIVGDSFIQKIFLERPDLNRTQ